MKHMIKITLVLFVALYAACSAFADSSYSTNVDSGKPPKQSLEADKIRQIRAIGQTILIARKSVQPDPEMEALRQRVGELRQTISALSLPAGRISLTNEIVASGKVLDSGEQERTRRENGIRNSLDELRRQRAAVEQGLIKNDGGERHQMKLRAMEKVQQLEDEIEQALRSPGDERTVKFKNIEKRLAATHYALTLQPSGREKTPTISTITHHRK